MRSVLADTGPLYALVDSDDRYHAEASQQLAQLQALDLSVIVLQPIFMESYTLILRKLGKSKAQAWLHELSRGVDLVNPTARDYEQARQRVASFPDQAITLFDSTLATLSQQLDTPVWTYDFHFGVMGIQVWRAG